MKDEHDISRSADWRRRGRMLDDLLAFLHEWWTANPVSWDSEFFSLPPVHADLRPAQALSDNLKRFAESGADEAFVDAFALFPGLDQMLDFAGQVIARTGRL
ncbi:hypothetical protein AB0D13_37715 [Streptomyces sp. NPDC048430]|uniref:hypothetical protein n=1 Tax=Streptomyces sp. NPDC048430 TaxID=3155388 RepID=UPI00341F748A